MIVQLPFDYVAGAVCYASHLILRRTLAVSMLPPPFYHGSSYFVSVKHLSQYNT